MDMLAGQTELRILLLEDEPTDAELVENALHETGLSFVSRRVDTREAFMQALDEFKPDIVLADYKLPAFDGGSAVKIVRHLHPEVPVVMVTGAMGDEKAVELLGLGARDYILKDRLARLGPAVQRALSAEQGIRARKAAEKALQQSEANLRALVEHSPVAMIVDVGVEPDEKFIMMNRKFTELFGYTMEDVPDVHHWWPLAYPDEKYREQLRSEWTRRAEKAVQSHGDIEPMEATVTCKDGSSRYIKASLASIGSRNIITLEDLTERRQAEEHIRFSEALLRQTQSLAAIGSWRLYMPRNELIWSDETYRIFGIPAGTPLSYETFIDHVHPDDRAMVESAWQAALKGAPYRVQHRIVANGAARWVEERAELEFDAQGNLYSATGAVQDITERKQMEDEIKEVSDRNRAIMETANDAIICMKPDGTIHLWNHKAEEMFGHTAQEVIGQKMHQLITPDQYRGKEIEGLRQFSKTGTGPIVGKTLELSALRKNGVEFPIELSVSAMNIRGEWHATGIVRDITERKQAEQKLSESEKLYRSLFENMLNGFAYCQMIFEQDQPQDFIYLSVNAAFKTLTGLMDPVGRKVSEVIPGIRQSDPKLFEIYGRVSLSGKPERFEMYVEAMQQWYWISVYSPEKSYFVAIFDVITERKQAEARIRKLTRLYATLSQTNTTIVRSTNRDELYCSICKAAVRDGKFVMAWVGLVDEATHRVRPVCHDGAEQGYLANILISVDDVLEGRGPTGTAIRENRVCFINNFATDERALPWREAALKRGFHSSAGLPLRLKGKIIGALTMYSGEPDFFDAEQLDLMEEMSSDISFALDGFEREALRKQAEEGRETALRKLQKALEDSVRVAASISEVRDPYTAGHQQRVSQLAVAIAREMGLPATQIDGIHFGGLIHDIGKIGVPAEILSKPSILTPLEMKLIQTHPQAGYEVVRDIEFPWPVAQIILQHHERLDGSGYPAGLKGDEIILEARIIAVADTVEAMWSHRPYRPGLGIGAALEEIAAASGTLFDKQAVDACLRLIREKGFAFKADEERHEER